MKAQTLVIGAVREDFLKDGRPVTIRDTGRAELRGAS